MAAQKVVKSLGYYCSKIYSQKFSKMAQPGNTGCHALPHSLSLSPFLFLLNQEKGNETKVKSNCAEKLFFPTIVFLFFFLSFIVSIFLSLSLSLSLFSSLKKYFHFFRFHFLIPCFAPIKCSLIFNSPFKQAIAGRNKVC